jgi:hypothetical protein
MFDGVFGDEMVHLHRPMLAQPMNPTDALFQDGRIPGKVHIADDRGVLQVEADPPGIG